MLTIYLLMAHLCMIMHAPAYLTAAFHAAIIVELTTSIYDTVKDYIEKNFD